jgi:GMP synthase-like glutamine amidotransferase
VKLRPEFFEMPYVSPLLEGLDEEELYELEEIGVFKVNSDSVSKLPPNAKLLASSSKSHHEIWSIDE